MQEYEYDIEEIGRLGEMILEGKKVGPLKNKACSDASQSIVRELGTHMIAAYRYVKKGKKHDIRRRIE